MSNKKSFTGSLRHRITIQKFTVTKDREGLPVEAWIDFLTVSADVTPIASLRQSEYFKAAAMFSDSVYQTTIRYREGITPEMRYLYKSQIFNIQSVVDADERRVKLILMSKEWVGGE
ncbi:MAG: Phage head-tail joining protein [Bacilli bacterium]|nr:Phage head-tail joining protein [Bacilli bacterium]